MNIGKPRAPGRSMCPLGDIDVGGALDQIADFMGARDLRDGIFSCPWCGEAACLTVTLFGPRRLAHAACSACGAKAIEE